MLALCTLSTETAEQLEASSVLLPALSKPLLQVSQPLDMTMNGKWKWRGNPLTTTANT